MSDFRDDVDGTQDQDTRVSIEPLPIAAEPSFTSAVNFVFTIDGTASRCAIASAQSAAHSSDDVAWTSVDAECPDGRIGNDDLFGGAGAGCEFFPGADADIVYDLTCVAVSIPFADVRREATMPNDDCQAFRKCWEEFSDNEFCESDAGLSFAK